MHHNEDPACCNQDPMQSHQERFFKKEKLGQFNEKSNRTGIEHDGNQIISYGHHFSSLSLQELPGFPEFLTWP